MGTRSSQLQIRVTPAEKETLKRLASAAGETVSSYVLSKVLPSTELELVARMRRLADPEADGRDALVGVLELLEQVPGPELAERVPPPDPDDTPPVVRNRIAALVESVANRRASRPPDWVHAVPRLPRPHFGWSLASLKPHQLRVTPVAFKRRNLFFDPATLPARTRSLFRGPEAWEGPAGDRPKVLDHLADLGRELQLAGIEVEFYFAGGALLSQAFAADPGTARVSALFRPVDAVRASVEALAARHGLSTHWLPEAARALLGGGPGGRRVQYVELPGIRLFEPVPEHALAVKCAAMRLGEEFHEHEDVRYLLRAMNVTSTDVALSLVGRYLEERQLAPDTGALLAPLLPS